VQFKKKRLLEISDEKNRLTQKKEREKKKKKGKLKG